MSTAVMAERKVPLLDLGAQHQALREEILAEVVRVIDSQKFIMGEDVKALESEIAAYTNTSFAVGCASGSDALFLALLAAGIGPGDAVLTTPYTFFATVGAICRTGATPVFADIDPATFNLDMNSVADGLNRHPETRAVIPVHLFGGCADMDALLALTKPRGIAVIEDAAQSIGSEYKGRRAGSIGDVGCFSFFPSKNLGGYGDGGIVTTMDPDLATRLGALRVHGSRKKYYHDLIGVNSRLDTLQAAVLRVKLRYLDGWTEARGRNADLYREILSRFVVPITLPQPTEYQTRHIYNQFVICCERRDELQAFLALSGIGTEVYYPLPMHLQPCFAHLGGKPGDYPISERLAKESLALPVYPELEADAIEYVSRRIVDFFN